MQSRCNQVIVQHLLSNPYTDVLGFNNQGYNPLMLAILAGKTALIPFFLAHQEINTNTGIPFNEFSSDTRMHQ